MGEGNYLRRVFRIWNEAAAERENMRYSAAAGGMAVAV
jgi:hypothetical protein